MRTYPFLDTAVIKTKQFTINCAQAAATYDLATVSGGDILIHDVGVFCTTAGATFTSLAIATNTTTATPIMSAAEGAVANLTALKNIVHVFPPTNTGPVLLPDTKKIQYTLVGSTGTGSVKVTVRYQSVVPGADIS
jgi:hypothetical protein